MGVLHSAQQESWLSSHSRRSVQLGLVADFVKEIIIPYEHVPGLNEAPDDGAAPPTGLLDTLVALLIEAAIKEDPDAGIILIPSTSGATVVGG
jgi:hypothetical protein